MKKILLYLADKPTPQIPESWLGYLDRYFHTGRHRDTTVDPELRASGWGLVARQRNDRMLLALGY